MTPAEFAAWKAETDKSKHQWRLDPIQMANHNTMLAYRGGENGSYVEIDETGLLSLGQYEGALPHIGEAMFTERFKRQYSSFGAAFADCVEAGGLQFLFTLIGVSH